jgi:protein disulfide-isomerase A1
LLSANSPVQHAIDANRRIADRYEKAADALKEQGSAVKLAKVECTTETELAERFEIQGYPTLKWFRNGQHIEFTGPREAGGTEAFPPRSILFGRAR